MFWATAATNAVLVAMNGWWTAAEMRNAIELTEPSLLIVDEARLARLDADPGVPVLVIERDFHRCSNTSMRRCRPTRSPRTTRSS